MNSMDYASSILPNGLKVVSIPMARRDSASVAVWVRVGGRFENQRLSGMSHFLEHMLFKGTPKRSTRKIKEEIEGVGGVLNAFTAEEMTCYFAKLLKPHYPKALEVLADMVNHASLDTREMVKERTVILEEIKMYRDLPSHHVHDLMGELLWPRQSLGRPISGTVETVSALTRTQMVGFKKKYYHPKNVLVTVSGPVEHEEVHELAARCFSQRSPHPRSKFDAAVSRQSRPRTLFVDKQTEQTHFVIGMHGFSRFHPDRYKLALLNVILGANMSSRLFEEVREKRGLAYEIKSGVSFYQDTGVVSVSAGVETKKTPKAVEVILKELAKMRKKPVTEGELRRAKDYFMSQLYMALEDTLEHLLWVGERALEQEDLPDRDRICKNIESVTAREIQEVARRLFQTRNLNLSLIGPVPVKGQKCIKECFEVPGT